MHVCGTVGKIVPQLLSWRGLTLLSHGFMGDKNDDVLESSEFRDSDKMLGLGCIDTKSTDVESEDSVAALIRKALEMLPPERVVVHPDCGLRMLPREVVRQKLAVMTSAAGNVSPG